MKAGGSLRTLATDWEVLTMLGSPRGLPRNPVWEPFSARVHLEPLSQTLVFVKWVSHRYEVALCERACAHSFS